MSNNEIKKQRPDLVMYSLQEVAQLLGLTHRTVWTYVKAGKIDARMIGNKWKVTEQELKAFLETSEKNTSK